MIETSLIRHHLDHLVFFQMTYRVTLRRTRCGEILEPAAGRCTTTPTTGMEGVITGK